MRVFGAAGFPGKILCAFLIAGACAQASADAIDVPFGLEWGTSKKDLERALRSQPVRVIEKRALGERDAWTLQGFTQENLDRVLIYFDSRGRMNEIELQYKGQGWSPEKYDGQASSFRRNFERKYGRGKEIIRGTKNEGSATIRMEGYEWRTTEVILRLIHFAARRKADTYNNISVHYRSTLSQ